jgi:hypothetical protein
MKRYILVFYAIEGYVNSRLLSLINNNNNNNNNNNVADARICEAGDTILTPLDPEFILAFVAIHLEIFRSSCR